MASRLEYFFRQRVTEGELNLGFELLERADRNLAADVGVRGIISGAIPVPHDPVADLTIDLTAPGRAYDALGQRVFFGAGERVDCSVDHQGLPTEVLQDGQERWLGVFLRFARLLSDPRTDGNSQELFFRHDESFELVVRQGAVAPSGTAEKVALEPDELLVCDVLRLFEQDQILAEHIDTARRQAFVFAAAEHVGVESGTWTRLQPARETVQAALDATDGEFAALADETDPVRGAALVGSVAAEGTPHALDAGTVRSQVLALLGFLNAHLTDADAAHAASAIAAATHGWLTTETVQAQLAELVAGLTALTGATRVQDDTITVAPPEGFEPYNVLAAGTLRAQLTELLRFLNRVWTVLTTAGMGYGSHVIGNEAIAGTPNAIVEGSVRSALAALLGFVNAHLNDTVAAHAAGAIATEDQDWMTGASLHTQLGLLPQKLGAYGIGSGGARKVGQEGYSHSEGGKTTAVTFGTLHDALESLVQHIVHHRGQSGDGADHDGLYARLAEQGEFTAAASTDYAKYTTLTGHAPPVVTVYYLDASRWVLVGTGPRKDDVKVEWSLSSSRWILHIANEDVSDSIEIRYVVYDVLG